MTRIFFDGHDVQIRIVHDGVEHAFPLAAIAAALRVDTAHLRARIDALLRAREHLSTGSHEFVPSRDSLRAGIMMEEEPTEMVVVGPTHTIPKEEYLTHPNHGLEPSQTVEATMLRRARARAGDEVPPLDAEALARVLGPDANVTAIASLIEGVPASTLRDALEQTLSVPVERLRAHPAALFTAIVRRLVLESSSPSSPHARTSTSST